MTVLELAIYSPDTLTSFGDSLLMLGKKLKTNGNKMVVCFPQFREWMKVFTAQDIPVEIVPIAPITPNLSWGLWFGNINAVRLILQLLKKYRVKIIHTHFGLESQIIACIAKLFSSQKVKVIWHWRSIPGTDAKLLVAQGFIPRLFLRIKRKTGILLYRLLDKLVSIHITVSDEIYNLLVTRKIAKASKIKLIYNGIDIDKYIPDDTVNSLRSLRLCGELTDNRLPITDYRSLNSQPPILIGNISNFMAPKDHFTFLEAVKLVLEKYPHAKFILVGDGPTRSKVEQYANELGIQKALIFTGVQKDVRSFINACNFTVFASLHEGFPNVPCECLALKKPVIATNVGGVPVVVKDGETGFLIPRKDAATMASRVIYLIEHPEEVKRLGENGRKLIEQKFTTEIWAQQIVTLFHEVNSQ